MDSSRSTSATAPDLAVIIPTLNEGHSLRRLLPALASISDEIIVSDGGSTDDTVEVAWRLGARVVSGPAGRGAQLNAGARATAAQGLLFLHADTVLADTRHIDLVRRALNNGSVGGGFEIHFDAPGIIYRFGSAMVNLRTRVTRLPLGDQGQFVSRQAFTALQGFKDWPILEDLDFIRRLRTLGKLEILTPALLTSARRFERYGPVRTLINNWLIFTLYSLGVPPRKLSRLYPQASD